jgi:hypothetical protein
MPITFLNLKGSNFPENLQNDNTKVDDKFVNEIISSSRSVQELEGLGNEKLTNEKEGFAKENVEGLRISADPDDCTNQDLINQKNQALIKHCADGAAEQNPECSRGASKSILLSVLYVWLAFENYKGPRHLINTWPPKP